MDDWAFEILAVLGVLVLIGDWFFFGGGRNY
jgi:hypothetical protein